LISPHASKVLAHWHVLLRNLLCRRFASVVLADHRVDWIYEKGKKTATEFARVEKCKGTGIVASIDGFKARTLGRYL